MSAGNSRAVASVLEFYDTDGSRVAGRASGVDDDREICLVPASQQVERIDLGPDMADLRSLIEDTGRDELAHPIVTAILISQAGNHDKRGDLLAAGIVLGGTAPQDSSRTRLLRRGSELRTRYTDRGFVRPARSATGSSSSPSSRDSLGYLAKVGLDRELVLRSRRHDPGTED